MRSILATGKVDIKAPRAGILDDLAQEIIGEGWVVGPGGTLLLKRLWVHDWSREVDPATIGEYEYEVNDVHLLLTDLSDDMNSYLQNSASRGLLFATRMLRSAVGLPDTDKLVATVGIFVDRDDEDFFIQGVTVRFFTRRGNYPMWFDDHYLEKFQLHALAVLDLGDLIETKPDPSEPG